MYGRLSAGYAELTTHTLGFVVSSGSPVRYVFAELLIHPLVLPQFVADPEELLPKIPPTPPPLIAPVL